MLSPSPRSRASGRRPHGRPSPSDITRSRTGCGSLAAGRVAWPTRPRRFHRAWSSGQERRPTRRTLSTRWRVITGLAGIRCPAGSSTAAELFMGRQTGGGTGSWIRIRACVPRGAAAMGAGARGAAFSLSQRTVKPLELERGKLGTDVDFAAEQCPAEPRQNSSVHQDEQRAPEFRLKESRAGRGSVVDRPEGRATSAVGLDGCEQCSAVHPFMVAIGARTDWSVLRRRIPSSILDGPGTNL